jgi:PPM family protein phosphatase
MAEPGGGRPADPPPHNSGTDRVETDLGVLAGVSDRGRTHKRNEDAMALGRSTDPGAAMAAVVCDGVSTSYTPERAARTAADAALDVLLTTADQHTERVRAAVAAAATAVGALERTAGRHAPSCTLVCALVDPDGITVGWVGDSRAYWLAPPTAAEPAQVLTTDHSWAKEMVAAGLQDEATAMSDPRAHAITRWLGADGDSEPDVVTLRPAGPGALLLCTDGLWNYLADPAGLAAVALPALADGGPIAAAEALTALALDAGGHDDITVVVIAV